MCPIPDDVCRLVEKHYPVKDSNHCSVCGEKLTNTSADHRHNLCIWHAWERLTGRTMQARWDEYQSQFHISKCCSFGHEAYYNNCQNCGKALHDKKNWNCTFDIQKWS